MAIITFLANAVNLRGVVPDSVAAQQAQEIVLNHDAGVTIGNCPGRALIHVHLAADPPQRNTAHRPAS
jgi:hypothetical protein